MNAILPISLGGVLGALSRYYLSFFIQKFSLSSFPFGTFIVNISGCALIGFVMRAAAIKPGFSTQLRLFLVTGFAGAYTTFSTFEYESCQLMIAGEYKLSVYNIVLSNFIGIMAVFIGSAAAGMLFGRGGIYK